VFDRPRSITRIEVAMAFPYGEFARHFEVSAARGEETWPVRSHSDPWYSVELVRQLVADPVQARLRYDLSTGPAERVRLAIVDVEEDAEPWTIPEIHVFEEDPPSAR
jgi:hypothetical protein